MCDFVQELNYEIVEENYVKDLQELLIELGAEPLSLNELPNALFTLECSIYRSFRDRHVLIHVVVEFDKDLLHKITLRLEPEDIEDQTNYEIDLKLFYHEEIKGRLFDAVNKKKSKYTLRNYKLIYNSSPIYGRYRINGNNTILFHTLNIIPKDEPLTEHIVCFDVEVEERNFERARSLANNIATEFCNFLSILLDVSFYEPTSRFLNFVTTQYIGAQKCLSGKRFRTAFYDPELKLFVKDNMNGLCPQKEIENGNFMNGYFSWNPNNGPTLIEMGIGNNAAIEETFSKHRIYKIEKAQTAEEYQEELDEPQWSAMETTSPMLWPLAKRLRPFRQVAGRWPLGEDFYCAEPGR